MKKYVFTYEELDSLSSSEIEIVNQENPNDHLHASRDGDVIRIRKPYGVFNMDIPIDTAIFCMTSGNPVDLVAKIPIRGCGYGYEFPVMIFRDKKFIISA